MTFKNFRLETDADGIALVTWDSPGRSMNVLNAEVIEEFGKIVETDHDRRRDQGRRHHLGQGRLLRRRRSHHAEDDGRRICPPREGRGPAGGDGASSSTAPRSSTSSIAGSRPAASRSPSRSTAPAWAAASRLALACHYRDRLRQRQDPRRPAGDQGRPVPRRRRHAARRAPDADGGRAADAVQGRADPAGRREEDGPHPRGRAARPRSCRRPRTG